MDNMSDEKLGRKKFLINDRVRYGLRNAELKGSMKWLLKRRGHVVERPFTLEGRKNFELLRSRR